MTPAPTARFRNPLTTPGGPLGLLGWLGIWLLLGHLAGCASTSLPADKERTAVSAGELAVVLLRVVCTVEDEQPYEAFSYSMIDDNISFGLGSFETGGEPKRLERLRFLSPESRKDGWTYLVVPQGIHYLAVYPPRRTDVLSYQRSLKTAPRWRMDIPANARLVYAGTLHLSGASSHLLLGGRIMNAIRTDTMSIANDAAAARTLLQEAFPEFGEPQTALLRRQEGPTILRSPLPSPTR